MKAAGVRKRLTRLLPKLKFAPLTTNEILTLIVATLALATSALGVYFQFLYSRRNVTATVLKSGLSGLQLAEGMWVLHVVLVNTGTENALIDEISPHAGSPTESCGATLDAETVGLPVVLKPRDMVDLAVHVRLDPQSLFACGKDFASVDDQRVRSVPLSLEFTTMTPSGDVLSASREVGDVQMTSTEVRGGQVSAQAVRIQ